MANELNITQDFKTMTLNLPANMVTVQVVVKTLKENTGIAKIITTEKQVSTHGVKTSSQLNHS